MENVIKSPLEIFKLTRRYGSRRQEHFLVLTLNGSHSLIKSHCVSVGTANKTMVHSRDVFYHAIKDNACVVVFVHNHPSGSLNPSKEDYKITEQLCASANILGFHVLDHLIINKDNFYSFKVSGTLPVYKDIDDTLSIMSRNVK